MSWQCFWVECQKTLQLGLQRCWLAGDRQWQSHEGPVPCHGSAALAPSSLCPLRCAWSHCQQQTRLGLQTLVQPLAALWLPAASTPGSGKAPATLCGSWAANSKPVTSALGLETPTWPHGWQWLHVHLGTRGEEGAWGNTILSPSLPCTPRWLCSCCRLTFYKKLPKIYRAWFCSTY